MFKTVDVLPALNTDSLVHVPPVLVSITVNILLLKPIAVRPSFARGER